MTNELKRVYEGAGALDRYYDDVTPVDLLRAKKIGSHGELMQPTIIGWYTKNMATREPDILIRNSAGKSPQYMDDALERLAIEGKDLQLTADILRHADQYIVKGCRTMKGKHRGISLFDKKNAVLKGFAWFCIPANTKLPDALAITRDEESKIRPIPIHYTVAPKDDMPLSLFLQYLKVLGNQAKPVET